MDKLQDFTLISPVERSRTYVYPKGVIYIVENVNAICVRPSGSHRLQTSDGKKFIVMPGFVAIEIDTDAWSL